jgi:hypothetical protein
MTFPKGISPDKDLSNKLRPFLEQNRVISRWNWIDERFYSPGEGQMYKGVLQLDIEEPVSNPSSLRKEALMWKDRLKAAAPSLPPIGLLQCNWLNNENCTVPLNTP